MSRREMSPFPPCGTRRTAVEDHPGLTLRVLSAWEVLEARREGRAMEETGREAALCANACLLARALERKGEAVFSDGEAVLRALTVAEIAGLARQWAAFSRETDPSPRDPEAVDSLKKAWSTRLTRAFSGVCSGLLGRCPPRRGPEP